MVSFLTVADIMGPMSSRSGKKISKWPTWLWGSRTTESTRGFRASLASRMISPVRGSTMSETVKAPSRSASVTSMSSTSAAFSCWMTLAVIFLPACSSSSRRPEPSLAP